MIVHVLNFLLFISAAKAAKTGTFSLRTPSQFIETDCLPLSPDNVDLKGQNLLKGSIQKLVLNETTAKIKFMLDPSVNEGLKKVLGALASLVPQDSGIDLDAAIDNIKFIEIPLTSTWSSDNKFQALGKGGLPTLLDKFFADVDPTQLETYKALIESYVPYVTSGCQIVVEFNGEFKDDDLFQGDYGVKYNFFCNGKKWNAATNSIDDIGEGTVPMEHMCVNSTSILAGLRGDTPPEASQLPPTSAPTSAPTTLPDGGADSMNASMLILAFSCFLLMISM